jgi:hypothetical protein
MPFKLFNASVIIKLSAANKSVVILLKMCQLLWELVDLLLAALNSVQRIAGSTWTNTETKLSELGCE